MSLSPRNEEDPDQIFRYRKAWAAINTMLEQGRSLSGHERHCAFLNTHQERFADVSAASGLDLLDDGRGVALVDWNHDGRIDLWTTNRTGPWIRLLENRSVAGHNFFVVQLEGRRCNRDAIGARLELHLGGTSPRTLYKSVRAGEGFVSQSSKRVLFGLGNADEIEKLVVRWPDGDTQVVTGLDVNKHYRLVQGESQATVWQPPPPATLPKPPTIDAPDGSARIVLANRVPLPEIPYVPFGKSKTELAASANRPTLINLWAGWCAPCLRELREWKAQESALNEAVHVVALNVQGLADEGGQDDEKVEQAARKLKLPFANGKATEEGLAALEISINALVDKPQSLVIPLSVLLDEQGRLAVIYRGPVSAEQILRDVEELAGSPTAIRDQAAQFSGIWFDDPPAPDASVLLRGLIAAGKLDGAQRYLQQWLSSGQRAKQPAVEACYAVADAHRARGDVSSAVALYRQALAIDPDQKRVNLDLGVCLMKLGQFEDAATHLETALASEPHNADTRKRLVLALSRAGRHADMQYHAQMLLEADEQDVIARLHLAHALKKQQFYELALQHYQLALEQQPDLLIAQNDIAWFLATCPDDDVRDGQRAVEFAQRACEATRYAQPAILDTLAAAQAEAGDFDTALATLDKAVSLAQGSGNERLRSVLQQHIQQYRQRKPLRDS